MEVSKEQKWQPSFLTLKHLQNIGLIPTTSSLIVLNSDQITATSQMSNAENVKHLVLVIGKRMYYGSIGKQGAEDRHGILIFEDGAYYEGEIKAGKMDGQGKLVYGEGKGRIYLYEGGWKRGIPNGFGIETIVNVLIYKGFFVDGKKSGQGVLKYADGSQFEGSFEGNRIEGTGVYKTNGHQWKGTWKNGYLQGEGQQIVYDESDEHRNSVYKGGFIRGVKEGKGKYYWGNNNCTYEGSFKSGQLDGEGTLTLGQNIFWGKWQQGTELKLQKFKDKLRSSIQFKKRSILQSSMGFMLDSS